MDAFVSRKRRKLSSERIDEKQNFSTSEDGHDEEESTDFKLALLSSLHPDLNDQILLDVLLANDGSVEAASKSLLRNTGEPSPKKPSSAARGYQSSVAVFATLAGDGTGAQKKAKVLSKKGKTLHLYTPEDVEAHTPCSIIHNFLPPEDANALLEELLVEVPTFERMTFKLFDNVVTSPHTSSFFVDSLEDARRQKAEYLYNGDLLTVCPGSVHIPPRRLILKQDVRQITPQMRKIAPILQKAVNEEVEKRIRANYGGQKLKYMPSKPWEPNAAFVNCYDGAAQSVGYHSDQLTYRMYDRNLSNCANTEMLSRSSSHHRQYLTRRRT
jgi:hypothetical protein